MSMFFAILIMACGAYMIYWATQMKREDKIPEMLVGKNFKLERAKDPEGFIKYTFPYTFVSGIILFASGLVMSLGLFSTTYVWIDTIISLIPVAVAIFYGIKLMDAQKKYLIGYENLKNVSKKKKKK